VASSSVDETLKSGKDKIAAVEGMIRLINHTLESEITPDLSASDKIALLEMVQEESQLAIMNANGAVRVAESLSAQEIPNGRLKAATKVFSGSAAELKKRTERLESEIIEQIKTLRAETEKESSSPASSSPVQSRPQASSPAASIMEPNVEWGKQFPEPYKSAVKVAANILGRHSKTARRVLFGQERKVTFFVVSDLMEFAAQNSDTIAKDYPKAVRDKMTVMANTVIYQQHEAGKFRYETVFDQSVFTSLAKVTWAMAHEVEGIIGVCEDRGEVLDSLEHEVEAFSRSITVVEKIIQDPEINIPQNKEIIGELKAILAQERSSLETVKQWARAHKEQAAKDVSEVGDKQGVSSDTAFFVGMAAAAGLGLLYWHYRRTKRIKAQEAAKRKAPRDPPASKKANNRKNSRRGKRNRRTSSSPATHQVNIAAVSVTGILSSLAAGFGYYSIWTYKIPEAIAATWFTSIIALMQSHLIITAIVFGGAVLAAMLITAIIFSRPVAVTTTEEAKKEEPVEKATEEKTPKPADGEVEEEKVKQTWGEWVAGKRDNLSSWFANIRRRVSSLINRFTARERTKPRERKPQEKKPQEDEFTVIRSGLRNLLSLSQRRWNSLAGWFNSLLDRRRERAERNLSKAQGQIKEANTHPLLREKVEPVKDEQLDEQLEKWVSKIPPSRDDAVSADNKSDPFGSKSHLSDEVEDKAAGIDGKGPNTKGSSSSPSINADSANALQKKIDDLSGPINDEFILRGWKPIGDNERKVLKAYLRWIEQRHQFWLIAKKELMLYLAQIFVTGSFSKYSLGALKIIRLTPEIVKLYMQWPKDPQTANEFHEARWKTLNELYPITKADEFLKIHYQHAEKLEEELGVASDTLKRLEKEIGTTRVTREDVDRIFSARGAVQDLKEEVRAARGAIKNLEEEGDKARDAVKVALSNDILVIDLGVKLLDAKSSDVVANIYDARRALGDKVMQAYLSASSPAPAGSSKERVESRESASSSPLRDIIEKAVAAAKEYEAQAEVDDVLTKLSAHPEFDETFELISQLQKSVAVAIAELKEGYVTRLAGEAQIWRGSNDAESKAELRKAQREVILAKKRLAEIGEANSLSEFIVKLKTIGGGAIADLPSEYSTALRALEQIVKEEILFVPQDSWLWEFFGVFESVEGTVVSVFDGRNEANLILITYYEDKDSSVGQGNGAASPAPIKSSPVKPVSSPAPVPRLDSPWTSPRTGMHQVIPQLPIPQSPVGNISSPAWLSMQLQNLTPINPRAPPMNKRAIDSFALGAVLGVAAVSSVFIPYVGVYLMVTLGLVSAYFIYEGYDITRAFKTNAKANSNQIPSLLERITKPIANYNKSTQTIERDEAFDSLKPLNQKLINLHEEAHQNGAGGIGATFAQLKYLLVDLRALIIVAQLMIAVATSYLFIFVQQAFLAYTIINGNFTLLPLIKLGIYSTIFGALAVFLYTAIRNIRGLYNNNPATFTYGISSRSTSAKSFTTEEWLVFGQMRQTFRQKRSRHSIIKAAKAAIVDHPVRTGVFVTVAVAIALLKATTANFWFAISCALGIGFFFGLLVSVFWNFFMDRNEANADAIDWAVEYTQGKHPEASEMVDSHRQAYQEAGLLGKAKLKARALKERFVGHAPIVAGFIGLYFSRILIAMIGWALAGPVTQVLGFSNASVLEGLFDYMGWDKLTWLGDSDNLERYPGRLDGILGLAHRPLGLVRTLLIVLGFAVLGLPNRIRQMQNAIIAEDITSEQMRSLDAKVIYEAIRRPTATREQQTAKNQDRRVAKQYLEQGLIHGWSDPGFKTLIRQELERSDTITMRSWSERILANAHFYLWPFANVLLNIGIFASMLLSSKIGFIAVIVPLAMGVLYLVARYTTVFAGLKANSFLFTHLSQMAQNWSSYWGMYIISTEINAITKGAEALTDIEVGGVQIGKVFEPINNIAQAFEGPEGLISIGNQLIEGLKGGYGYVNRWSPAETEEKFDEWLITLYGGKEEEIKEHARSEQQLLEFPLEERGRAREILKEWKALSENEAPTLQEAARLKELAQEWNELVSSSRKQALEEEIERLAQNEDKSRDEEILLEQRKKELELLRAREKVEGLQEKFMSVSAELAILEEPVKPQEPADGASEQEVKKYESEVKIYEADTEKYEKKKEDINTRLEEVKAEIREWDNQDLIEGEEGKIQKLSKEIINLAIERLEASDKPSPLKEAQLRQALATWKETVANEKAKLEAAVKQLEAEAKELFEMDSLQEAKAQENQDLAEKIAANVEKLERAKSEADIRTKEIKDVNKQIEDSLNIPLEESDKMIGFGLRDVLVGDREAREQLTIFLNEANYSGTSLKKAVSLFHKVNQLPDQEAFSKEDWKILVDELKEQYEHIGSDDKAYSLKQERKQLLIEQESLSQVKPELVELTEKAIKIRLKINDAEQEKSRKITKINSQIEALEEEKKTAKEGQASDISDRIEKLEKELNEANDQREKVLARLRSQLSIIEAELAMKKLALNKEKIAPTKYELKRIGLEIRKLSAQISLAQAELNKIEKEEKASQETEEASQEEGKETPKTEEEIALEEKIEGLEEQRKALNDKLAVLNLKLRNDEVKQLQEALKDIDSVKLGDKSDQVPYVRSLVSLYLLHNAKGDIARFRGGLPYIFVAYDLVKDGRQFPELYTTTLKQRVERLQNQLKLEATGEWNKETQKRVAATILENIDKRIKELEGLDQDVDKSKPGLSALLIELKETIATKIESTLKEAWESLAVKVAADKATQGNQGETGARGEKDQPEPVKSMPPLGMVGFFGDITSDGAKSIDKVIAEGRYSLIFDEHLAGVSREIGKTIKVYELTTQPARAPPVFIYAELKNDVLKVYFSEKAKSLIDTFNDREFSIVLSAIARHELAELEGKTHEQAVAEQKNADNYNLVQSRLEVLQGKAEKEKAIAKIIDHFFPKDEQKKAIEETKGDKNNSRIIKDKNGDKWHFVDGKPFFSRSAQASHTAPGESPHQLLNIKGVNPNIYWQRADRNRDGKEDALRFFIDNDRSGDFTDGDEIGTIFDIARRLNLNTLTIFGDIINHPLFVKEYLNSKHSLRFIAAFELGEYDDDVDYTDEKTHNDFIKAWSEMIKRIGTNRYVIALGLGNEKRFDIKKEDFAEQAKLFEQGKIDEMDNEWLQAIGYHLLRVKLIIAARKVDPLSRPIMLGNHEAREVDLALMEKAFEWMERSKGIKISRDNIILGVNLYDSNDIDEVLTRVKNNFDVAVFLKEFGCPSYILALLLNKDVSGLTSEEIDKEIDKASKEIDKASPEYKEALDKLFNAKTRQERTDAKKIVSRTHRKLLNSLVQKAAALRAKADREKDNSGLQEAARIIAEEVQSLWITDIMIKTFYNRAGFGKGNVVGYSIFRLLDARYGANYWMGGLPEGKRNDPRTIDPVPEVGRDRKPIEAAMLPSKYFIEDYFGIVEVVANGFGLRFKIAFDRTAALNKLFEQKMPTPEHVDYAPDKWQMPQEAIENIIDYRSRQAILKAYKLKDEGKTADLIRHLENTYFTDFAAIKEAEKRLGEAEEAVLIKRQARDEAVMAGKDEDVKAADIALYLAKAELRAAEKNLWKLKVKSSLRMVISEAIWQDKKLQQQGIKAGEPRGGWTTEWALDDAATIYHLMITSLAKEGRGDEAFVYAKGLFKWYKHGRIWAPAKAGTKNEFKSTKDVLAEYKQLFVADEYDQLEGIFKGKDVGKPKSKPVKVGDERVQLVPDQSNLSDLLSELRRERSGYHYILRKLRYLGGESCGAVKSIFTEVLADWKRYVVRPIDYAFDLNYLYFDIPGPARARIVWLSGQELGAGVIQILDERQDNTLMTDKYLNGVFAITLRKTGEREVGGYWYRRGFFRRRLVYSAPITIPIYEVIFEHDGQLKTLSSIWDLREAIKNNGFSAAKPANVIVFKFKAVIEGKERLVVALIDKDSGYAKAEVLRIEQHPQHGELRRQRNELLKWFGVDANHNNRPLHQDKLNELDVILRQLLNYDIGYTNYLVSNKSEILRSNQRALFRVNTVTQHFFEIIGPGLVRVNAEVDKTNPYGARVVRDVKANIFDPEERIEFLKALLIGDFSGFKSKDTGLRVLSGKLGKGLGYTVVIDEDAYNIEIFSLRSLENQSLMKGKIIARAKWSAGEDTMYVATRNIWEVPQAEFGKPIGTKKVIATSLKEAVEGLGRIAYEINSGTAVADPNSAEIFILKRTAERIWFYVEFPDGSISGEVQDNKGNIFARLVKVEGQWYYDQAVADQEGYYARYEFNFTTKQKAISPIGYVLKTHRLR